MSKKIVKTETETKIERNVEQDLIGTPKSVKVAKTVETKKLAAKKTAAAKPAAKKTAAAKPAAKKTAKGKATNKGGRPRKWNPTMKIKVSKSPMFREKSVAAQCWATVESSKTIGDFMKKCEKRDEKEARRFNECLRFWVNADVVQVH